LFQQAMHGENIARRLQDYKAVQWGNWRYNQG
jgi:hypothetical protein